MDEISPDPTTIKLETLLARKRQLSSIGVSFDGYQRWGNGSDPAFAEFARTELENRNRVVKELDRLTAKLALSEPEALAAWARAHVEVLEDYLRRVLEKSTETFVAKRELAEWRQVEKGELPYVDENPVYVKPDPELYLRLFGVEFPKLYW